MVFTILSITDHDERNACLVKLKTLNIVSLKALSLLAMLATPPPPRTGRSPLWCWPHLLSLVLAAAPLWCGPTLSLWNVVCVALVHSASIQTMPCIDTAHPLLIAL